MHNKQFTAWGDMIVVSWQSIYVKCWKIFHVRKRKSLLAFKCFVYSVCVCVFVFMCMRPGLDSSGFSEPRSYWLARVGSQWAPDVPVPTGYWCIPTSPAFLWVQEIQIQFFLLAWKAQETESSPRWPIVSSVHVSIVWMHPNLVSYPCHWAFTLFTTFSYLALVLDDITGILFSSLFVYFCTYLCRQLRNETSSLNGYHSLSSF